MEHGGDAELFQQYHQQKDECAKLLVEKENAETKVVEVSRLCILISLCAGSSTFFCGAVPFCPG
jgi:hypothetical protein